jgi:hypothetical protein
MDWTKCPIIWKLRREGKLPKKESAHQIFADLLRQFTKHILRKSIDTFFLPHQLADGWGKFLISHDWFTKNVGGMTVERMLVDGAALLSEMHTELLTRPGVEPPRIILPVVSKASVHTELNPVAAITDPAEIVIVVARPIPINTILDLEVFVASRFCYRCKSDIRQPKCSPIIISTYALSIRRPPIVSTSPNGDKWKAAATELLKKVEPYPKVTKLCKKCEFNKHCTYWRI